MGKKVLIVVDPQNDFMKGGSLEVPNANEIIPIINKLIKTNVFDCVIFTQDWHSSTHKSFASQHKDCNVFDVVDLNGIEQVLWPDHCIQDSHGAKFHQDIDMNIPNFYIFKKGMNDEVDSYSGFYDNDHKSSTGLSEFLEKIVTSDVFICGLALDFCVKYTALDCVKEKFKTTLIKDATRAIAPDIEPILDELIDNNIGIVNHDYFM